MDGNICSITAGCITGNKPLSPEHISSLLDQAVKYPLGNFLWGYPAHPPRVDFAIAHDGQAIYLKFFVNEQFVRREETRINGRIWEDSCVEFFISFNDGATYYNFEYNSICTGLIGYGSNRTDREMLPEYIVRKVKSNAVIDRENDRETWELTMRIPVDVFIHDPVKNLTGKHCRVNFYKCGDLLPEPHFLAWSRVESAEPDFHKPSYFGDLRFG